MRWVLWFQRPQFIYAPNDKVRTGACDWPSHWRRALFLSTLASVHDILCWTVSVRERACALSEHAREQRFIQRTKSLVF